MDGTTQGGRLSALSRLPILPVKMAILLLAALLRLISLHDVPPGLAPDEVMNADIATAILNGQHALFFRQGFGHEPLYHYVQVPFQVLLGDNFLAIRLPAVLLGLVLIAMAVRWIERDFGEIAAVAAGLGLAISWWPVVFSRVGIRPILEVVLLVATAWFWQRRPWVAGVFLGLSLYTYTAARVAPLIPLLTAVYCYVRYRERGARWERIRSPAIVFLTAVILYVPLHLTLSGDPTLQERVSQLSGPLTALQQGDPEPVLEMTLATLGVFTFTGDPRTTYSIPGRPLFDPLTSLLFFAGGVIAIRRVKQPVYAYVLIWLGVTLVPSAVTPRAPSLVRLIGAMPVVYLLPGLSVDWLVQRLRGPGTQQGVKRALSYGVYAGLLGLLTLNVFLTVRDGFVRWPQLEKTRRLYHSAYLDIARHWDENPAGSPVVAVGYYAPLHHDLVRHNLGRDVAARWVQAGSAIVFPASRDGRLYIPETYPLAPELREVAGIPSRPIYRSEGPHSFALYTVQDEPAIQRLPIPVELEDAITFLGYEERPCQTGGPLKLVTYWRVKSSLAWDLTLFVHLLNEDGSVATQHDGLDAVATRLHPGDRFLQLHELPWPTAEPSPAPTLQVGAYLRTSGRRLAHDGQPPDRIILSDNYSYCNAD